jgi:hypothetical protein
MTPPIWPHHGKRYPRHPHHIPKGTGKALTNDNQTVHVRHILGFTHTDWGEANWTAKDMR